jgi:ribosomal protein S6 kinase beta
MYLYMYVHVMCVRIQMEYLPGGELFYHLSKQGLLLEANAVFYSAEMVLALEVS